MVSGSPVGSGATMPILRRRAKTSRVLRTSSPATRTVPDTVAEAVKSIVRFRQRSIDVLPDCAGPITARISLRYTSKEIPWRTSFES